MKSGQQGTRLQTRNGRKEETSRSWATVASAAGRLSCHGFLPALLPDAPHPRPLCKGKELFVIFHMQYFCSFYFLCLSYSFPIYPPACKLLLMVHSPPSFYFFSLLLEISALLSCAHELCSPASCSNLSIPQQGCPQLAISVSQILDFGNRDIVFSSPYPSCHCT